MGTYHLGEIYDINWFSDLKCNVIKCKEENINDLKIEDRYIVIIENGFLLFEPEKADEHHNLYCTLLFYATFDNLVKVKRSTKQKNIMIFLWSLKEKQIEIKLEIENNEEILQKILEKMKDKGANVQCNKRSEDMKVKEYGLTEEEMTKILENIQKLEKGDISNSEKYFDLMNKYQIVLQSSIINNKEKESLLFLEKIKKLSNRQKEISIVIEQSTNQKDKKEDPMVMKIIHV